MSDIDRRKQLANAPFSFRAVKNGTVFVSFNGKQVTVLNGEAARRFLERVAGLDDDAMQLELAKVTGNFKRGNERLSQHRSRS